MLLHKQLRSLKLAYNLQAHFLALVFNKGIQALVNSSVWITESIIVISLGDQARPVVMFKRILTVIVVFF